MRDQLKFDCSLIHFRTTSLLLMFFCLIHSDTQTQAERCLCSHILSVRLNTSASFTHFLACRTCVCVCRSITVRNGGGVSVGQCHWELWASPQWAWETLKRCFLLSAIKSRSWFPLCEHNRDSPCLLHSPPLAFMHTHPLRE